jgi:hypothetical protein
LFACIAALLFWCASRGFERDHLRAKLASEQ